MKGRWQINDMRMGLGWNTSMGGAIADEFPIPVVPCDDAAEDRIARWLHTRRFGCEGEPCDSCRYDAKAVLRVAGET